MTCDVRHVFADLVLKVKSIISLWCQQVCAFVSFILFWNYPLWIWKIALEFVEHNRNLLHALMLTINEPPDDKTNKMTYVTSEDPDQPGHLVIKRLNCIIFFWNSPQFILWTSATLANMAAVKFSNNEVMMMSPVNHVTRKSVTKGPDQPAHPCSLISACW